MRDPAIVLDRATLAVAGHVVISEVSLSIEQGEFVGILGPNGAGKTTLMRAVLGLLPPKQGDIVVLGKRPRPGAVDAGYLPQSRTVPADARLNGWEVVASAFEARRWGPPIWNKAAREAVDDALDAVDARGLAQRPIATLSGGERQRLLIAQALVARPRLLVLDEPLMSLDPRHQDETIKVMARLHRETGATILLSAHEISPLANAVDRVLYLGGGGAAIGSVDEVVTSPVLSGLYGTPIEVVHLEGRIFVMADGHDVEHQAHGHHHA